MSALSRGLRDVLEKRDLIMTLAVADFKKKVRGVSAGDHMDVYTAHYYGADLFCYFSAGFQIPAGGGCSLCAVADPGYCTLVLFQ